MEQAHLWVIENIKAIRKAKGLSQKDLAEKSSLTPSQFSLIENGKQQPGINILVRIASALEVEVGEFFMNPDVSKRSFQDKLELMKNLPENERSAIETMIDIAIERQREKER